MIPWDEQKQASNLYWAARRRPAQDAQMLRAAGQAKVQVERSPLGRVADFVGDVLNQMGGGEGVGTFQQDFTIVPEKPPVNVGTGPRRDSVPMPRVTPQRPTQPMNPQHNRYNRYSTPPLEA